MKITNLNLKNTIIDWVLKVDNFGYESKPLRLLLAAIALLTNIFINMLVFSHYSFEANFVNFSLWILSALIGSFLIGWISDKSTKSSILFSQLFGLIGLSLIWIYGINLLTLCFLALLYSPITAVRALFVHELYNAKIGKLVFTNPRAVAITQALQALPWILYTTIQPIEVKVLLYFVLPTMFLNALLIVFFYSVRGNHLHSNNELLMKSHDISERSNKSPSARSSLIKLLGITNGFKMIAFISAETVYFLSAVLIVKQSFAHNGTPAITENNSGLLFKAAAIGVLLGSLSHFLIPRKKYHSSYRTVITYTYFFGFSTLFLSTHSAQVFHDQQAVLIFIGSIAFFGAIYIPLVFSLLFKQFHAPHRGIASAVGEGAQGLAEWIAPFIALLLVGNYQFGYFLSGLYLISFILNILSHWFAVRNGEEE